MTKEGKGIATSTWFSGDNDTLADGRIWIYAETAGGTVRDSCLFFNSDVPDNLYIFGWQDSLLADGEAYFEPDVVAIDLNGNPVIGGTPFKGRAGYVAVTGSEFFDGCSGSSGTGKVTSKVLKVDASLTGPNDDGIGARDLVTFYTKSGASVSESLLVVTTEAYRDNCSINGESSVGPSETVYLSCTIKDRYGNPLGDHTLVMTQGATTIGTEDTDQFGDASGFVWTAPATEGDYIIVVQDTDPRGGIVLTLKISVAAS